MLHKSCHKVRPTEEAWAKAVVKIFLLHARTKCYAKIHTLFKCSQLDSSNERQRKQNIKENETNWWRSFFGFEWDLVFDCSTFYQFVESVQSSTRSFHMLAELIANFIYE